MILEKVEGNWFIHHSHSSLPFNFQDAGSSYPTLEGIGETLAKWLKVFDLGIIEYLDTQQERKILHYLTQVQDVLRGING